MQTSPEVCIDQFSRFKEAALNHHRYSDNTVVQGLFWPELFRTMRILRNHIRANLSQSLDKLIEIPFRKTLKFLGELEEVYPSSVWDDVAVEGDPAIELGVEWEQLGSEFRRNIRALYNECRMTMAHIVSPSGIPEEFASEWEELLDGIDKKNCRVSWRDVVIPCPHENFLIFLRELCLSRIEGLERQTLTALNKRLSGEEKDRFLGTNYSKVSNAVDSRLKALIDPPPRTQKRAGYGLNSPAEILVKYS